MNPIRRILKLFRSRIFRGQFFSFFVLIAGSAALFSAAINIRTSGDLAKSQTAIAERYRDQIKAHIADWLDGKTSAVKAIAAVMGESTSAGLSGAAATGRIVRIMEAYSDFTDILIIDEAGRIKNSRQLGAEYKVSLIDREYFREAMTGPIGITGFFSGRNTGRQAMTVAKRFRSADGGTFVAAAFITLERFSHVIDALNKEGLAAAYLVDSDAKKILGSTSETVDASAAKGAESPRLSNPAALAAAKGGSGVLQYRNRDGETVLGAFTTIDELNAGLVVELRRELFMEPIEQLQRFVFMIGLAGAAIALIVAFALSSRIFRPIEELIRAVDGIAASDYSRSIALSTGNELDALIERFNRMQKLLAERETNLKDDASKDSLTGLYNHGAIMEYLKRTAVKDAGAAVCFVMIDIDHFKKVNDDFGHQAGDEVLVTLAGLLRSAVRGDDLVGRYGGEEFAVVLREWTETDNEGFCERLRERIAQAGFSFNGQKIRVTISIGWARSDAGEKLDPSKLVNKADTALYRAKANGRNRVERG